MFSLLAFILNAKFIVGFVLGGLVGKFVLPYIWKEGKN